MLPTTYVAIFFWWQTVAAYYENVAVFTMHDLVHDLAMYASKQGNTGESRIHFELLDDSTKSLQAFTQYPTNVRGLRFLESDKTVCHGAASSSSAKFKSVQVCGKIGIYDDDVFSSAKDLHVLDLSECSIRKLPNSIGDLKLLRYLNAPRVQHWVFPYRVMKLSKLTYLSLRGSSVILALPDSIGEMEGLMYLDLSGCSRIKKLPVSFGKLTKLVHLDFSKCSQVTYVSESLKSLTNLEYLDLSHCKNIGVLLKNLGRLLKLRNLNISYSSYVCSLDYWWPNTEVLFTLTKLECLNLSSPRQRCMTKKNLPEALKLSDLSGLQRKYWLGRREGPIAFGNLKNLVYLDLSGCSAVDGVLDTLGSLTKLQHLNLSRCSYFDDCTDLHLLHMSQAIGNLTELRYLNLSDCSGAQKHPKQAFSVFLECIGNLLNLEHLDLSWNVNLTSLPECFGSLGKLHTLNLTWCCCLVDIPANLYQMGTLRFLELKGCHELKMLKQDALNKSLLTLPHFLVQADCHDSSSNLILLQDVNRTDLEISRLENVKSAQEARSIELARKDRMENLKLSWTKDVERSVEDMEVLGELVPPTTLKELRIDGYNSVRFPEWFIGSIAFHLPNLVGISMSDFPKCKSLPPLGLLPNLQRLELQRMNGVSEINWDLCGSRRAFPRLKFFRLCEMESLKVWCTIYSGGREGVSEFMFPILSDLEINDCPNLRMKPCPHTVSRWWTIKGGSYDVISSWEEGEGASQISVTSSASVPVPTLFVSGCEVPMHQWRLLHHLPGLTTLHIGECCDLSSSPEITRALSSLRSMQLGMETVWGKLGLMKVPQILSGKLELPNWLGHLASLEDLTVRCHQVKAPHDGFPHLTRLRSLCLSMFVSMTTLQPWLGTLASLQRLEISICENLNDLPESIGRLTSLKHLDIRSCYSITSLPESIGCLTSLERLRIRYCDGITSLPESIQQLTKLKTLDIDDCEELEEWCKTEENKAKLAHIKEKVI